MAINYSLAKRKNTFTGEEKVYPTTQYTSKMDLDALAKHISDHGSVYTRDVILGVLTAAVDCIREQLLNGVKINLGDMGTFWVSCGSEGTATAEEFDAKNITKLNVKWSKGKPFKNILDDAEFVFVPTRERQAAAKKAQKEDMDNGTTADQDTEPGEETGGSGSGDGSGRLD